MPSTEKGINKQSGESLLMPFIKIIYRYGAQNSYSQEFLKHVRITLAKFGFIKEIVSC
jgi:hypothetical protein